MSIIENIQNAMDKKQITPYQLEKAGIVNSSELDDILVNVSDYIADKVYKFYAVFV